MGCKRPRRGRHRPVEANPSCRQLVERRARGTIVAVEAQMAGSHRVQHDQEHIRGTRRGQRRGRLTTRLGPVRVPEGRCQNQHNSSHDREADPDHPPEAGRMPLQPRYDPRRQAQHQEKTGQAVNAGKSSPERRKQRQRAEQACGQPPAAAAPSETRTARIRPRTRKIARLTSGISQTK